MYLIIYENGRFRKATEVAVSFLKKQGKTGLHFRLQTKGENAYSDIELYTDENEFIDSCFVANKRENVNAETGCYLDGAEKCAVLRTNAYSGEEIEIDEVRFTPLSEPLFDGGVLYQLAPAGVQMMGYVYITKEKKVIVIDGGNDVDKASLAEIVNAYGGAVHHWFITHYHSDHIGAVIEIFKEGKIKTEKLYFHFPDVSLLADRGDIDNPLVEKFLSAVPENTTVVTPRKGDRYEIDEIKVRVLNDAWFEKGNNFVNDSSIVYKLETPKNNVLFTGDLGLKGDDYLRDDLFKKQIKDCKIVQMAHHGQSGVSKDFYDHTGVEICLYPTPLWLWNNDKGGGKNSSFWTTLQTREWMRERNVKRSYASVTDKTVVIY